MARLLEIAITFGGFCLGFDGMAPHMTDRELDQVTQWASQGLGTADILDRLTTARKRRKEHPPTAKTVRRAMTGVTFRRGKKETRGRKKKLSPKNLRQLNSKRKELIRKAKGEREVHWDEIIAKARVPKVDATTAVRSLRGVGVDVAARKPREKPMRKPEHEASREQICTKWARRPASYFTDAIDLIIDNTQWDVPLTIMGKRYNKMRKVRFHNRTRSEGVQPGYTKPSVKKHRINTGGTVKLCAGLIGCKVRIWHYLPKSWNGAEAAALYRGPIAKALKKHAGVKRSYSVMEDNDPTGYKSNAAKAAKKEVKIRTIEYPRHSPDLNPLDYFLWSEVERRMDMQPAPKKETVEQYKARLRRTAMAIPKAVIRKGIMSLKKRARAVMEAHGGDIPRD